MILKLSINSNKLVKRREQNFKAIIKSNISTNMWDLWKNEYELFM